LEAWREDGREVEGRLGGGGDLRDKRKKWSVYHSWAELKGVIHYDVLATANLQKETDRR
jgi:hypothetical protein